MRCPGGLSAGPVRAVGMAHEMGYEIDPADVYLDVLACHANGCRLALGWLLEAPNVHFAHDVFGIREHIDRESGALRSFFLPRAHSVSRRVVS